MRTWTGRGRVDTVYTLDTPHYTHTLFIAPLLGSIGVRPRVATLHFRPRPSLLPAAPPPLDAYTMALEDITRATLAEASVDSQQRQLGQLDPDMPAVPASSRRMRTRVDSTSDALALADNKENFNLGLPRSPVARITKRKISLTSSGWSAPALAPTSIPGGALDSATTALPAPTTAKRARYTTNPPSSAYERLCAATRRSSRQHAHVRARAAMMMMAGPAGSATGKTVIPLRSAVAGDNGMVNLVTPSPVRPGEMSGAATVAALASNGARVPPAPLLLATHAHRTPLSPDLSSPPCSPIRRSSRLLALARTDTDDDESGDGGESDDDDDELARVQKEARERTMLAYAPGGGGRGRMRGAGAGVGFGAMRGAVLRGAGAGSAAARSAMLGRESDEVAPLMRRAYRSASRLRCRPVNTTPAYLSTFASHLSLADYRVTPNIDHPTHAVKDWSPAYTCAYSQGASGHNPAVQRASRADLVPPARSRPQRRGAEHPRARDRVGVHQARRYQCRRGHASGCVQWAQRGGSS